MDWKPIETITDDEDVVLVCNPAAGTLPVLARKIEGTWYQHNIYGARLHPEPKYWTNWPKMPQT